MAEVEIYTTMLCLFCHRAKGLLRDKGTAFTEIDVTLSPHKRRHMAERAGGRRTVPQIFIDGEHIGGSRELAALERDGRLDAVLRLA
jgi:glutaredoxin 3